MNEHMTRVGKNLSTANTAYNQMVGSFESQVLTQAKRFETLKVETSGKSIEQMPVVDASPRPLTKLASTPSEDEPQIAAE
jgi:DNA recombination protein RmuC